MRGAVLLFAAALPLACSGNQFTSGGDGMGGSAPGGDGGAGGTATSGAGGGGGESTGGVGTGGDGGSGDGGSGGSAGGTGGVAGGTGGVAGGTGGVAGSTGGVAGSTGGVAGSGGTSGTGGSVGGTAGSGGFGPVEPFIELRSESRSEVLAVSGDGTYVVGLGYIDGVLQALRWVDGNVEGLGVPDAWISSQAGDVSEDGSTVVGFGQIPNAGQVAFRWHEGQFEPLPMLAGGDSSASATAVSGDGRIAFGIATNGGGEGVPVRWLEGAIQTLPTLEDASNMIPKRASYDGAVVAGNGNGTMEATGALRFLTQSVEWLNLLDSRATDVSADGLYVVGEYNPEGMINGRPPTRAYRWRAGYPIDSLPLPAAAVGDTYCFGEAVSGDGSRVIGYCQEVDGLSGINHYFVWDQEVGMTPVETLLLRLGVDITLYRFTSLVDISADGNAIIGVAVRSNVVIGWRALIDDVLP